MSLRTKTLAAVAVIFITLAGLIYAAASAIIGHAFFELDYRATQASTERTLLAIQNEIAGIGRTNTDYAAWDDSYTFVVGDNPAYIDRNLNDETFRTNRFGLMLFVDSAGALVFGKGFNLSTGAPAPIPAPLRGLDPPSRLLLDLPTITSGVEGLMITAQGPLMVSSRPILSSAYTGPAHGALIIGRPLDDAEIARFATSLRLKLTLHSLAAALPPDVAAARAELSSATPDTIRVLDEDHIAGYRLLTDIAGQPAAILRVEAPRNLYAQGQITIRYLMLALIFTGALLALIVGKLLDRAVLTRLDRLGRRAGAIGAGGDLSARLAIDGDDEIARLAGDINRMLDSIEQAQAQLRESKVAAEAASQAKSRFLATMSHELRTPLTAIIGYSELVQLEAARAAPDLTSDIEKIRRSGVHLLALIDDVLDMARIEAGRMTIQPSAYRAEELIQEVIATLSPLAERNQNRITMRIAGKLPELYTDIPKVRQILLNLANNACKFTSNGQILIVAEPAQIGGVAGVAFHIIDSGIGISPEQIGRLFREFEQIDAQATRRYGGTGLGLALSLRLCQLLCGTITVTSTPGHGSTFTTTIPALIGEPCIEKV